MNGSPPGWLSRSLSLLGVIAISWAVIAQNLRGELQAGYLVSTLVACVAWLLLIVLGLRGRTISIPLLGVMVVAAAIPASATNAVSVVVAAIAVLWLTRDLRRPVWWGALLAVVAIALVVI